MFDFIIECMRQGDINTLTRVIKTMKSIDDVILDDGENSLNLLHLAAGLSCEYREAILEFLLDLGADANYSGREDQIEGVRALHIAASWGYDMSVKILLLNKADASLMDSKGLTPIDYASVYDNYTCIAVLLKYGSLNTVSDTSDWSHIFETSAGESSTASFSFSPFNHSALTPSRTPSSKPNLTQTLVDQVSKINLADTTCNYYTAAEDTISQLDKSFIESNSDQSLSSSQTTQKSSQKDSSQSLCFTNDSPPPRYKNSQTTTSSSLSNCHDLNQQVDGDHTDDDYQSIDNEQTTHNGFSLTLDLSSTSNDNTSQDDTRDTAFNLVTTPDKSTQSIKSISNQESLKGDFNRLSSSHDELIEFSDNISSQGTEQKPGEICSSQETNKESSDLFLSQGSREESTNICSSQSTQNEFDGQASISDNHDEPCGIALSRKSNGSRQSAQSRQSGDVTHSDTDKSIIGLDLDRYVTRESLDSNLQKLGKNYADIMRNELKKVGQNPGPITASTKRVYMKLLLSLQRTVNLNNQTSVCTPNQKLGGYSSELRSLLKDRFPYDEAIELEKEFILTSDTDSCNGPKQFFNYLLLDPRVSNNLCGQTILTPMDGDLASPMKGGIAHLKVAQKFNAILFTRFIKAIFYIGKGQKKRDFAHLYDALADRNAITKAKIDQIRSIWSEGFGVISLHVFNNISSKEALTREALMIDAIGLDNLTNLLKGTVKIRMTWNEHKRKLLGTLFLWKAFSILLNEGERQLRREDLNKRIQN